MNKHLYDIVVVAHEKDFNNIKFIVEYAAKNLNFNSIHLIVNEPKSFKDMPLLSTLTTKPVYIHHEENVLKINKSKVAYRPNWIYQMLLKMFQNVTESNNFLIIEADCIILKPIPFFIDNKTIFYTPVRDQNHPPYFEFNRQILNIDREYNHTFISEFIMYDKKIVKEMLKCAHCNCVEDFVELIYKNVSENCYPADYELYGNFCYKYYRNNISIKTLNEHWSGRDINQYPSYTDSEIKHLISINQDKDSISFHTWT